MVDAANPEDFLTGLSPTFVARSNDAFAGWVALTIAASVVEVAAGGYSLFLTQTECNHDEISIIVSAVGAATTMLIIHLGTTDQDGVTSATWTIEEPQVVKGTNIVKPLKSIPYDGTATLTVNGVATTQNTDWTLLNGQITWDAAVAGYDLEIGDELKITYEVN